MQEAEIRAQLASIRREFQRVESEYRVLVDLNEVYVRWLKVLGLEDRGDASAISDRLPDGSLATEHVGSGVDASSTGDFWEEQSETGVATQGFAEHAGAAVHGADAGLDADRSERSEVREEPNDLEDAARSARSETGGEGIADPTPSPSPWSGDPGTQDSEAPMAEHHHDPEHQHEG